MADNAAPSPHFFTRDKDGTVRLRMRFTAELAGLIEKAAGETPLMEWIYTTLQDNARQQVEEARRRRPSIGPPVKEGDQR